MRDKYVAWRYDVLQKQGGLPAPAITNREWLYLLKNETRNSIMVEGIFVNERELEKIISRGSYETRNAEDVMNYFRTARFLYGLGFENFTNREMMFSQGMVRQINKGTLEGQTREPGVYRKGKVVIGGASVEPPEFDVDRWMGLYVKWILDNAETMPLLRFLALQHSLFEAIHSFADGNGRTGRIITNYLLLSRGFPIIIVKGNDRSRDSYYRAMQEADTPLTPLFRAPPVYETLCAALETNSVEKLETLFFKGLRESMDRLIVAAMEQRGVKMLNTGETASALDCSLDNIRKLVERGKLISVVRGKTHFSHPDLLYKN